VIAGRRRDLVAAAILGLVLVAAEADVVFGGKTFQTSQVSRGTMPGGAWGYPGPPPTRTHSADPGASAWTFQPHARVTRRIYASGELPLWNPHEGLGVPFAAEMQTAVFSPIRAPVFLSPTPVMDDALAFARLLVAGVGAFFLARRLGTGRASAVLAGTAFMLSGFFTAYTTTIIDVDVLLPWILLAFDALALRRSPRAVGVAACSVALAIVAGFPESTFFVLAMAGIFFAFRAATAARRDLPKDLARFVAAAALGHLAAAFVLLPFVEFLRLAIVPEHPEGITGLAHYPAKTAITLLVPNFFGPYYQEWNGECLHLAHYLGVVPVFLALLAPGRGKPLAWFLAVFAGVGLLKIYGTPGLNEAIGSIPPFSLAFFSRYFQPEVALATALLAGLGLERLVAGELSRRRVAATTLALVAAIGALAGIYKEALAAGAWRISGPLVATEAVLLAGATLLAWPRPGRRRAAGVLLVALAAVELILPVPRERPLRHDPYAPPPYVEFLEKDPSPFRIFTSGKLLHANTASVFGIDDVRSLEPMHPARFVNFVLRFLGGVFNDPPPREPSPSGSPPAGVRSRF
jgi:hypothetical protein